MNPEIKQLWVDALRSGKYKKGVGKLHKHLPTGDEFCCLGVLCKVAIQNGLELEVHPLGYSVGYGDLSETAHLPVEVIEWADLSTRSPRVGHEGLVNMNDATNQDNFYEIAAAIEENL